MPISYDGTLKKIGAWAVFGRDPDDEESRCFGYFTRVADAEKNATKNSSWDAKVVPCYLWQDEAGRHYQIGKPVEVDLPSREDVLAKLTEKERKAIGF